MYFMVIVIVASNNGFGRGFRSGSGSSGVNFGGLLQYS